MFIIKTTTQVDIRVDADELAKIAAAMIHNPTALVFLRNGAVQPRMIACILPDDRADDVLRLPGETDEGIDKRRRELESVDIFESFRKQLGQVQHKQLLP